MKLERTSLICDLCGGAITTASGVGDGAERSFILKNGQHRMVSEFEDIGYQHWPVDPTTNGGRDHLDVCGSCCGTIKNGIACGIITADLTLLENRYKASQKAIVSVRPFNVPQYTRELQTLLAEIAAAQ